MDSMVLLLITNARLATLLAKPVQVHQAPVARIARAVSSFYRANVWLLVLKVIIQTAVIDPVKVATAAVKPAAIAVQTTASLVPIYYSCYSAPAFRSALPVSIVIQPAMNAYIVVHSAKNVSVPTIINARAVKMVNS